MNDLYLKFPDQPTALEVLRPLGMTYVENNQLPETDPETGRKIMQTNPIEPTGVEHVSQGSHQYALWEVGEIIGVDGWHINLRIIDVNFDVSGLEAYVVEPQNPVCVWA
jgi:hypothetical protein